MGRESEKIKKSRVRKERRSLKGVGVGVVKKKQEGRQAFSGFGRA